MKTSLQLQNGYPSRKGWEVHPRGAVVRNPALLQSGLGVYYVCGVSKAAGEHWKEIPEALAFWTAILNNWIDEVTLHAERTGALKPDYV